MGDINQVLFIKQHIGDLPGPYLEVGSKDYGTTQDLRSLVADRSEYTGADMEEGPGVDVVLDFTKPFEEIDRRLGGVRFGTIFCLSVLEHCEQPFAAAENLTHLLKPGGRICISAPFAWQFHGYPSDYWRFTHEGVRKLFPQLTFAPSDCAAASSRVGDFWPLDEEIGKIPFRSKPYWRKGRFVRAVTAKAIGALGRAGILGWLAGYPYVLAPTSVFMIGTRSEAVELA
jgi:SAM-dependent methyltransferase